MLTTRLLADTAELFNELESCKPFLDGIQRFHDAYESIYPHVAGTAEGGAKINEFASQLHSAVVGARQMLDEMPIHEFFRSVDRASHAFVAFMEGDSSARRGAQSIATRISAFSGLFDRFVRQQKPNNAIPVLREAHALRIEMDAFLLGLRTAIEGLSLPALESDEESISLTLYGTYSLSDIAQKLNALREVCQIIKHLLEGTDEDAEFRVLRIETGSISLALAAGAVAIAMLRRFLVAAVQFSYRNYTREGQLRTRIPDEMKALEELIKLRTKLDKAGINTDAISQKLEASGNQIAQNLAVLILKENHVRVDNEDFRNKADEEALQLSYETRSRLPRSRSPESDTDENP